MGGHHLKSGNVQEAFVAKLCRPGKSGKWLPEFAVQSQLQSPPVEGVPFAVATGGTVVQSGSQVDELGRPREHLILSGVFHATRVAVGNYTFSSHASQCASMVITLDGQHGDLISHVFMDSTMCVYSRGVSSTPVTATSNVNDSYVDVFVPGFFSSSLVVSTNDKNHFTVNAKVPRTDQGMLLHLQYDQTDGSITPDWAIVIFGVGRNFITSVHMIATHSFVAAASFTDQCNVSLVTSNTTTPLAEVTGFNSRSVMWFRVDNVPELHSDGLNLTVPWATTASGANAITSEENHAMVADADGNLYVAGAFGAPLQFRTASSDPGSNSSDNTDPLLLPTTGFLSSYFASVDAVNGSVRWAFSGGGMNVIDYPVTLDVSDDGLHVLSTLYLLGEVDFNGYAPYLPKGMENKVHARGGLYGLCMNSATGYIDWSMLLSAGRSQCSHSSLSLNNEITVVGSFSGPVQFGLLNDQNVTSGSNSRDVPSADVFVGTLRLIFEDPEPALPVAPIPWHYLAFALVGIIVLIASVLLCIVNWDTMVEARDEVAAALRSTTRQDVYDMSKFFDDEEDEDEGDYSVAPTPVTNDDRALLGRSRARHRHMNGPVLTGAGTDGTPEPYNLYRSNGAGGSRVGKLTRRLF
jgi:hypothetical protein